MLIDKEVSSVRRDLLGWRDAVASCCTLSRLHVLLSMMDVCIKWDKSAENAVSLHWLVVSDNDHRLLMPWLAVVTVGVVMGFVWSCHNALSYFAATFSQYFGLGFFPPEISRFFYCFYCMCIFRSFYPKKYLHTQTNRHSHCCKTE